MYSEQKPEHALDNPIEQEDTGSTVIAVGQTNVTGKTRSAMEHAGLSEKGFAEGGKTDFGAAFGSKRFRDDFMGRLGADEDLPPYDLTAAQAQGGLLDEHFEMLAHFRDLAVRAGKTFKILGLSDADKLRLEKEAGRNGFKSYTQNHADRAFEQAA